MNDATKDREQLWVWHQRYPNANWAVATGAVSNIFVVDIDVAKSGYESWDEWEMNRRGPDLPDTARVRTGSGGMHLFFAYPSDRRVGNKVNQLRGVDVRGDGGHVILPGSRHVSGGTYEWLNPGTPVAVAPSDLLDMVVGPSAGRTSRGVSAGPALKATTEELRHTGFRHGERDDGFNRLAWRLVRNHWPHMDLVKAVAREVFDRTDQDDDPLPWSVVEYQIERAWTALEPKMLAERAFARGWGLS